MKKILISTALTALAVTTSSCFGLFKKTSTGEIIISFDKTFFTSVKSSDGAVPSPDDFILVVADSEGNEIYHGNFGASPEIITVNAGSYTVTAVSGEFEEPLFETPQYGDIKIVDVQSGMSVSVVLTCRQTNCGVRLEPDTGFKAAFPEGVLYLKGNGGMLMYGYSEKRTAYFKPGGLTVLLSSGEGEETICTRTLEAQQMLVLGLSSASDSEKSSGEIELQVDTAKNWTYENIMVGGNQEGNHAGCAYNVSEAREHIGESGIWVEGYVVGIATNTGKFSFSEPFSKNTNIVLGLRSTSTNKNYLLSVELPKGGVRDALNLMENPKMLGVRISLKGTLTDAYYGIPGLKGVTEFIIL